MHLPGITEFGFYLVNSVFQIGHLVTNLVLLLAIFCMFDLAMGSHKPHKPPQCGKCGSDIIPHASPHLGVYTPVGGIPECGGGMWWEPVGDHAKNNNGRIPQMADNSRGRRFGENHHRAKLSDHDCDLIFQLCEEQQALRLQGMPHLGYREVGEKFEVTAMACWFIHHGLRRGRAG